MACLALEWQQHVSSCPSPIFLLLFLHASGWASMSFVKAFDESMKDKYELVLVSVRPAQLNC